MIIAGLTGGIATGKSTVSRFLSEAGALIIDADKISREVVSQGTAGYNEILSFFGRTILLPDGEIDRKRLGEIIFNDPEKKAHLDAIVHPRVFERSAEMIAQISTQTPDAVVILDIPLLLEADMGNDLAELIVVYVPEILQLKRLMKRDGIDEQAAMARIRSQMPIEEKRKRATVVIDNSRTLSDSRRQALAVFNRLKQRSKNGTE
ncbi:dephospho-CoA kinase [uncultured Desulfosarcina sp.]|uniref:dephospho-CoA kinase n=1 Tax=uncultured Desulfosarcina sp. TaxID=218289 RepID=UPI0029C6DAFB|nr:dephospho-CoA kinase [uncultured Desulfosarcina sp.]